MMCSIDQYCKIKLLSRVVVVPKFLNEFAYYVVILFRML